MKPIDRIALYAAIFGLIGWNVYEHYSNAKPSVGSHGVALGKAYATRLPISAADGWDALASVVEKGGTMAEGKAAFDAAYQAEFIKTVAPEFARILPEGMEPATPLQRSAFAGLAHDFAHGLRGGK